MDERELLANRFEEHRQRMRAVAYRMLGSLSEAEDAVQEAWLRLDRSGSGGIENLGGWLTTVVGRVCLNMLRSRGSRREQFLGEPLGETSGARIPDPIVDREEGIDPEHQAALGRPFLDLRPRGALPEGEVHHHLAAPFAMVGDSKPSRVVATGLRTPL